MTPHLSVIVPAYQEAAYIARTLDALRGATPIQVVVVANGCTDGTAAIARAHGVHVVETPVANVSRARNVGARASAGTVLVFLDADTRLGPGALDTIGDTVPDRAEYGTCRIRPDRHTPRAAVATTLLAWGHRLAGTSLGVLFCTRALFERSGGFDERLVAGEDNDLNARFRRLGARRIYLGRASAFTSMRRFERLGYVRTNVAWLRGWFHPPSTYEAVR
jgi:glycosyltransferase involved in cell wall biosynthesis